MGVVLQDEKITLEDITERLLIGIVSDIHLFTRGSEKRLRQAIDTINSRDVDLVFLLGDYVTNATKDFSPLGMLAELESQYGVYAVLGNHDYSMAWKTSRTDPDFAELVTAALVDAGVTVLRNKSLAIDTGEDVLNLVGVDNLWYNADIQKAFSDAEPSYPAFLLAHQPETVLELSSEHRTDLVLSGHTHGYMIRFPSGGHILPYVPVELGRDYDKGFKEYGGRLMYITSGLGRVSILPRIFNPPEVVFLEVLPSEN